MGFIDLSRVIGARYPLPANGDADAGALGIAASFEAALAQAEPDAAAPKAQSGYGDRPGGVPIAKLHELTPQEARSRIVGHLDDYARTGSSASFEEALDLATAWRAQGGDASGFDAIRARVGETSREGVEATVAQRRAAALGHASGEIRALNRDNVNYGAQLYQTLRDIGAAADPDAAAYSAIRNGLVELRGDISGVGSSKSAAFRKTLDAEGYGALFADAARSIARETAQRRDDERARLAQMSLADRLRYGEEKALDVGADVVGLGALQIATTIGGARASGLSSALAFRRASEIKPSSGEFPTNTAPTGPIGGKPFGAPETVRPNADPADKQGVRAQNDALARLADRGYQVVQQPTQTIGPDGKKVLTKEKLEQLGLSSKKNPDAVIEGRVFDVFSPTTGSIRNIYGTIAKKAGDNQANRIVLNLRDSDVPVRDLRQYLRENPIPKLNEILLIDKNGNISNFFPFKG